MTNVGGKIVDKELGGIAWINKNYVLPQKKNKHSQKFKLLDRYGAKLINIQFGISHRMKSCSTPPLLLQQHFSKFELLNRGFVPGFFD